MPDVRSPQLDDWLDEEISALLETVEADPYAGASMEPDVLPAPAVHVASRGLRAHVIWARARVLRVIRTVLPKLVYGAAALVLAAFIGWLVTQLTP